MTHASAADPAPDAAPGPDPAAGVALDAGLAAALARLATVSRLLVASDYDGVLAPIVTDPALALPLPGAVDMFRALAALPGTTVAAVSGRARDDLARVSGLPPTEVTLVGSHGSELDTGIALGPDQAALHARLTSTLRSLVDDWPGVRLETKPASVVVHTRTAERAIAADAAASTLAGPATWPGVHVTTGKEVVELSVLSTHKGTAVEVLRAQSAADAVLFLGDDVTDENAFGVLRDTDVGIKVGPGETRAQFRVPDPPAALAALRLLLRHRTGQT